MIFVYSEDIKNFELNKYDKNDLSIIDCNLKNCFYLKNKFTRISYKKIYNNYNYIPYIKIYSDPKYNSLYSCYSYIKKNSISDILLIFDIKNKSKEYLDCINSFVKRKYIKKVLLDPIIPKQIFLNQEQCKFILGLTEFLIKTKVVSVEKNFFDFVYNYYFYLNEKDRFVE